MNPAAIYIFGCGGGAIETLEDNEWLHRGSVMYHPDITFVEDEPQSDKVVLLGEEYHLISTKDVQVNENTVGHITAFSPDYKERIDKMFEMDWVAARSKSATGKVGWPGLNIRAHSFIGATAIVGRHVKVNYHSFISHNCVVGDYTFISHNVGIGGGCTIGSKCEIYEGSIILPGKWIGDNTTIGAGSLVTKDIPPNVVAYGSPCTVVRKK